MVTAASGPKCSTVLIVMLALAYARPAYPQAKPSFEVASIKPSDPNDSDLGFHESNGRFAVTNYNVKRLVAFAYGVEIFQVLGGLAWTGSDRYDIIAKIPDDLAKRREPDDVKRMVQALLSDRFKLAMRTESRELPIYALVVDKNGSKLHTSKPTVGSSGLSGSSGSGRTQWIFTDAPLYLLTHNLSQRLGRPVVDRTNLNGNYDFKLKWTTGQSQSSSQAGDPVRPLSDDSDLTIFTAIQEQLGLRLESQKGPAEVFIIDHAEKPADN
jgi:uncharacterized protein (TIGR03435 family)